MKIQYTSSISDLLVLALFVSFRSFLTWLMAILLNGWIFIDIEFSKVPAGWFAFATTYLIFCVGFVLAYAFLMFIILMLQYINILKETRSLTLNEENISFNSPSINKRYKTDMVKGVYSFWNRTIICIRPDAAFVMPNSAFKDMEHRTKFFSIILTNDS